MNRSHDHRARGAVAALSALVLAASCWQGANDSHATPHRAASALPCSGPFRGAGPLAFDPDGWKTDFCRHAVPYGEIRSGGPPRDGIPPIDAPRLVRVAEAAAWLSRETGFRRDYGRNPYPGYDDVGQKPFLYDGPVGGRLPPMAHVIGVRVGGGARAYQRAELTRRRVDRGYGRRQADRALLRAGHIVRHGRVRGRRGASAIAGPGASGPCSAARWTDPFAAGPSRRSRITTSTGSSGPRSSPRRPAYRDSSRSSRSDSLKGWDGGSMRTLLQLDSGAIAPNFKSAKDGLRMVLTYAKD